MPVKTFLATFCHEDWSSGQSHCFSEMVKARNLEQAKKQAGDLSLEMGPDTLLMDTIQLTHPSMPRLHDRYNQWVRREHRPAQYRYRYSKRRCAPRRRA